jgi:hypothetical protein
VTAAISNAVNGDLGFFTDLSFSREDLEEVRQLIREQWLARIAVVYPSFREIFEQVPMDRYHEYAHLVDHKYLWPKTERILPVESLEFIRATSLIKDLEAEFGPFVISNEDQTEREEIYWRLVRPKNEGDVGPIHADAWFWELGHGKTPANMTRVKVWVAIYCETGVNGFRMVPGSHKREWPYGCEMRDGLTKPKIKVDDKQLDINIFKSQPGQAIVFNDKLLHGGVASGTSTRVSIEFTMFVRKGRAVK